MVEVGETVSEQVQDRFSDMEKDKTFIQGLLLTTLKVIAVVMFVGPLFAGVLGAIGLWFIPFELQGFWFYAWFVLKCLFSLNLIVMAFSFGIQAKHNAGI